MVQEGPFVVCQERWLEEVKVLPPAEKMTSVENCPPRCSFRKALSAPERACFHQCLPWLRTSRHHRVSLEKSFHLYIPKHRLPLYRGYAIV
ncbi:hypothetical protein CDAR_433811 [Caerostris darwini]|uniref:Uncharacterized protein n=1 Tax=Caerostris darwini TaxID=1538125 RepID=A0AAV4SWD6_9ARAC|nr:hypothetical protein CDAR_433811 [Caerostris darwini]